MLHPRRLTPGRLLILLLCAAALSAAGCRTSTPVLKERGFKAYQAQNYTRARDQLQQVIERDPTDLKAQYTLGRNALAEDQPDLARTHFEVALTLARAETRTVSPTVPEIIDGLSEAMYQNGDHTQLVGFLKSTLERGTLRDYLRLADYYQRMGDPDNALVTYRKAIRHAPDDPRPFAELADFYDELDDKKKAIRYLRMAYFLDPKHDDLAQRLRSHGVTPGPTAGLKPVIPE